MREPLDPKTPLITVLQNAIPPKALRSYLQLPPGREAQRCKCSAHFQADSAGILVALVTERRVHLHRVVSRIEMAAYGPNGSAIMQRMKSLTMTHLEHHGLQPGRKRHLRLVKKARRR